jgi:cell division protein FtsN
MARDYKHAKNNGSAGLSAGGGFLIGLSLGLAVAVAVYLYGHRPSITASQSTPVASEKSGHEVNKPTPESAEASDTEYEFYDVLPKLEVVVPEKPRKATDVNAAAGAIDTPGSYVLQAGSYRNFVDADRLRAQLALQGIESSVQKVTVDADTWHRVRIGPINNLSKLEETRRKLREAQIDAMVIRLGKNR